MAKLESVGGGDEKPEVGECIQICKGIFGHGLRGSCSEMETGPKYSCHIISASCIMQVVVQQKQWGHIEMKVDMTLNKSY